jgi:hypothetical protein
MLKDMTKPNISTKIKRKREEDNINILEENEVIEDRKKIKK